MIQKMMRISKREIFFKGSNITSIIPLFDCLIVELTCYLMNSIKIKKIKNNKI